MKYRLKKDLPWASAGTIHTGEKHSNGWYWIHIEGLHSVSIAPDTFSDWFEEVDERWKPIDDEKYFIVDSEGYVMESEWEGYSTDYGRYNIGNCFKKKADAERAAEQIKALLKEFHKNNS